VLMCKCFHSVNWHSLTTLTGFPVIFLSCKANVRVFLAKMGARSANFLISELVVLCIVCVYICVLYYCHRMATQLQLIDIYHIISYHILLVWECLFF